MSRRRRKRNPELTDEEEVQTATLLVTEGSLERSFTNYRGKVYKHQSLRIKMCYREAIEPASKVFGTKIGEYHSKERVCPPHLFLPDRKGIWETAKYGTKANQIV
jgi:hypothetical protein